MTRARAKAFGELAWEWKLPVFAATVVACITILFSLLLPALARLSFQAHAGQQAKARQCANYPGSLRSEIAAYRRGDIFMSDVRTFINTRPTCTGNRNPAFRFVFKP